jgi:GT2 family glycosyltransferase
VVVAHDAARLLPGLVQAVRAQTHPVHRVVGVDTGSRDRSGATLTELLGQDAVFGMEPDTGFGAAAASALQHPAARPAAGEVPASQGTEWIWLLHDDCEPADDALEQLLAAVGRSRSVAVLGPKLKDASDRRVVREAGITTDRAGRRLTGVEPGEIDQGQHDGSRTVLAVSSAGMLVRRDAWDQLGGFDANLPLFRDDIDFCWRAHAAGYEVWVVTDAVVYHRELAARQIRKIPAVGGDPRQLDRRSALYVFAVNLPLWPMLTVAGGCVAGSLARAACYLLTKQQGKAAAHLGAVAWLLRHPRLLWRERRCRAGHRKHGYAVLRGQLPRGRTLGRLLESAAGLLSRGSGYDSGGLHHAVDEPGDDLPLPATDSVARRVLTSPGVLLFAGLAVVALVAERSLTSSVLSGSAVLGGGALVPPWGGAGALWHEYLAGYHDTGIGSTASTSPYVGVMAVLATVLGGKPWLATDVLLLGCVPLAGATAFLATRRLTPVLAARIWISASYALLPVATGAVAAGRIGTAVAFVLLPLIGAAFGAMLADPPRAARRAAWAAGLLIAIVAAFVPLAWPVAVVAALGAAAAWPWLGPRFAGSAAFGGDDPAGLAASGGGPVPPRGFAVNAAIAATVPAVLLIPWTFRLVTSPSLFFAEAGLVRPGLAAARLRPESLLLLSPGGPGLPPAWVTAGLVLPAFGALLARRRTVLVYTGWGIALAGLVTALVVSRVRVTPPQGGPTVSAWPGLAMAVAAAGLLLAATPLIEAIARTLGRAGQPRDGQPRAGQPGAGQPIVGQPGAGRLGTSGRLLIAVAGLAAVVSAPALAAGYWLEDGLGGPVAAAGPQILPPFVAASSAGPDRDRTLVLRDEAGGQDGGTLTYAVLRDADPALGEPELAENTASTHAMDSVVASLAAAGGGDAGDTGQALSQFDIGYVLLPAPIDQTLAVQLNAAAGLEPLTRAPSYDLWQVSGTVARVRVITPGGTTVPVPSGSVGVNTVVAAGTSGTLVLAEAAGGWSATLNGKPLTPLAAPVDGWAQGFALPPGGGHLVITRHEMARDISLGFEAAALLVAVALALPGTRASAAAEAEAVPALGRRRERAEGARPVRRERQPQVALAGVTAGGAAGADDQRVGSGPAAGADGAPFGLDPGPEYGADAEYSAAADPGYGADGENGAGADPGYEGYPPWAGLPYGEPGAQDRHDPAPASSPAPPRRGRGGQHAARHGKPSRRRGGSDDRGDGS